MKKLNSKGFSAVEAIIIVLVVAAIGGVAYYVGTKQNNEQASNTNTASTNTKSGASDSSKEFITYKDNKDNLTFKYPSDWKLDLEKADEVGAGFVSGPLTSPSGKVTLAYSNYVVGVGGGSCPEAFPCPTVHIVSVKDVPGAKDSKLLEKITDWKGNGDGFTPSFGLTSASTAKDWPVGSKTTNDFYLFDNFSNDGGYFAYLYSPDSRAEDGFKTYDQALAFLNSAEAKAAKQILLSVQQN